MKTTKIWRLAFAMLAAFSLASCSSDDNNDKDITKEMNMSVSAEPGVMYDLFDSMGEHPIECMRVMTEDEPGQWQNLYFSGIKGFTYERGHEYELRVKRTILANPPQDASNRTYELVRILADKKVEDVAELVEKVVKSEADIEYEQQCPVEKYAIAKGGEYMVDADGNVTYADGTPTPEFDKHARIYLENILDKSHPLWQSGARYMATYAYVLSPLTDEIHLVPSNRSAILFKNILTESEMAHVQQSMKQGETLRYGLILCNVYKRAIQKVEFTIKKK
ncbi:MAG: DUF4377 domain-containing protein [Bacteroidaceae bacterium]|nr:DUF4377 domain-containing protein [Bacteroidaceae bacterium]